MASGSGKNQDHTETKEPVDSLRQREESNAAAAAATELPPLASRSEITEEEVHGPSSEAGGPSPSSSAAATAAAAAAEQKGKETIPLSRRGFAGDKPPLPPRRPYVPRARGGIGKKVLALASGIMENRIDMKSVYNELMLEAQRESSGETDQKAEAGTSSQQNEQVNSPALWPKKGKKRLWSKILDRIGISNKNYTMPHVNFQKLHTATELIRHYNLLEMVAGRGVEFPSHALNLSRAYSEFRPVHGDGECFYRSFIFSYLEQVLDRQDTHEEHRLLAAVKVVARQHARLGWASEFSRSHKAFKKLIKKVMRWKSHRRWKRVPTINRYRIEKLLEFFNDYKATDDIFTFLRLVAAIWICSHSEEYVPLITELNEGYTLTDWCFQEVIQRKVFTDRIQITALVRALRVPLRVVHLFQEAGQDLYIGQDSQDDYMPRNTCWPRHRHQVPPDHEVPRVTVLYTPEHYDIIYPVTPGESSGQLTSGESSGQQSDKIESLAAKSQSQHQTGSCSGETSNQQIDLVEGSTSTGEKSDKHNAEGES